MAETTGVDSTTRVNLADTYVRKDASPNNSALSMDDFWKLLAAQLRYQDSSNPMSNSEMMGQLVQMGTMSAMDNMSTTITDAMNSLSQISLSSYATGLLGKEITVADVDKDGKLVGETTGKVEGIALTGTNPYIFFFLCVGAVLSVALYSGEKNVHRICGASPGGLLVPGAGAGTVEIRSEAL